MARWKNVAISTLIYEACQRRPRLMRSLIRRGVMRALPAGYDVDTHFNPTYGPWDQRLCLVPGRRPVQGDLARPRGDGHRPDRALHAGRAQARVRTRAARPTSIVTATGLNLLAFGGVELVVDGEPVSLPETLAYKGMMLSGVPNFVFTIGYTNASWTLKADLVAEYVCRLLARMDEDGERQCVPVDDDPTIERRPLLDFAAGYVQRSVHLFPKAGSRAPWRLGHELRPGRRHAAPRRPRGRRAAVRRTRRERVKGRRSARRLGRACRP